MKLRILAYLLLAPYSSLLAESITLTRSQAAELYVALAKLELGLSPANAITAADNLNELRPAVEAFDKGKIAFQRQLAALPAGPDQQSKAQALIDALESKADESLKFDLQRIDLTPDEITAAKIPPSALATLRRHLKPKR